MLRKPIVLMMTVVSMLAALAFASVASASAAQRIDMKVLLLGTSTTEPDFASWQAALQREGVPFETIITSPGHAPITAATLSDTLANGTPEGKYQGIIVSVANLPTCTTTCVSTLSQTEWAALEEYEQTFNVRQITGDVFPSATYGLNAPTISGEFAKGAESEETLTTEGKTVFPYLNGPVAIDAGTYGYRATPLTTQATGASFKTLVTGPSSSALVGVYTRANGIQELVETFDQNQYQLQAELLRHGALNWVTRGVYFGDQRNYYEADIDDNFLSDDSWNTATHEIDYSPADAVREEPKDVENAAAWSAAHKFRMDMLFNGGGSHAYAETQTSGIDPLLTAFQTYKNSFGWISHTWDHPNIDVGCATQSYIETELNENNTFAAGKIGLTVSTAPTAALGNDNPQVIITGEHSGLANLAPGNPGVVDPPNLSFAEAETAAEPGKLAAGTYVYAVTDDFAPNGGQSIASVSAPVTVTGANGTVSLSWQSVCHAAEFKVYREVSGSTETKPWKLVGTISAPTQAPPNAWFANPTVPSTPEIVTGGAQEVTFTDKGETATASSGPPAASEAVETPYPQNPNLIPAFTGVGIKYFGSDASKPYPNPNIAGSTTAVYPAGSTFNDGPAQSIPRYPTNIYYNASTEAEAVDEYNTVYTPTSSGGKCVASATNTCETKALNFAEIVNSVDTNMFQHVMGNDPRPHYFHQPNIMGTPPPGPPTTGTPPATEKTVGDGLFYSVLNPLLEQYNKYFTSPIEQPTMAQIGQILAEQQAWSAANASQVTGYIEGNQVTVNNSGTAAVNAPFTGVNGIGSAYGGITSGWASVPAAASTHTAATTWPAAPAPVQQEPQGSWVGKVGSAGYLLAGWSGTQDYANLPSVTTTVEQGSRYLWASGSSDARALQSPDSSTRNAATYYDPAQLKLKLTFATAYSGNLRLYAVDWDAAGRRETITLDDGSGPRTVLLNSDFSKGAWVTYPVNIAAGGAVSITVVNNSSPATTNAVLSGIFLGDAGTPPGSTGLELSKGGWVGGVGKDGYDLAGFDGANGDVAYLPNATMTLQQGSRYQWAGNTTDLRALSDPGQHLRNAGTYYDPNEIKMQLSFKEAYSGNLHLYAVDWDSEGRREVISANGQTAVLSSDFSQGAWVSIPINVAKGGTVSITVSRLSGGNAVLSGIFLGNEGAAPAPKVESAPQGKWVGTFGSGGYDLAGWNGTAGDLAYMPNASLTVQQASRYEWAANTADARALSDATGATHNAGTYYDSNQIQMQLSFKEAYSGELHLYAVDWDAAGRREVITVNGQSAVLGSDFSQGAWVSFPVSVAAGGTVSITVTRLAGGNAVLSGVFLGNAGTPPAATVTSSPQGTWSGVYGGSGYDLAGWNGESDLTELSKATLTVEQASRYTWAESTEDVRALQSPDKSTRNASTYYDPNEIKLKLTFNEAYSGTLRLYAVDWDSTGRREVISVNGQNVALSSDFSQGAWVSVPVSVAAGGTVSVTVTCLAGGNAVLSGIFLG